MKKVMSALLALSMLLGTRAGAVPEQSDELKKAITVVRKVVDIDDSYSNFYSSSDTMKQGDETITIWNLSWSKEDYTSEISARVDSLGNLESYWCYDLNTYDQKTIGGIRRAEAKKTAESFIQKLYPTFAASMQEVPQTYGYGYYTHDFEFQMMHNGIPVDDYTISVDVSRTTGSVVQVSGLNAGMVIPTVYDTAKPIDLEAAKQAFIKNIGMELQYMKTEDNATRSIDVALVYAANYGDLDAVTGEVDKRARMEPYGYYMGGMGDSASSDDALNTYEAGEAQVSFSSAEVEEMARVGKLMSQAEAEKLVRDTFPVLENKDQLEYASLIHKAWSDTYSWQLGFRQAYAIVDAQDKIVTGFSGYGYENTTQPAKLTQAQATAAAQSFAAKQMGEKLATMRQEESYLHKSADDKVTAVSQFYTRLENGVPVANDGVRVTVSTTSGYVISYDYTWIKDVTFAPVTNVITKEAAFDVLNTYQDFGQHYVQLEDGTAALVYRFENIDWINVDAVTGTLLDYNGNPYVHNEAVIEYIDLAGHWSESTVTELKEYGYYLMGAEFHPDQVITVREFCEYLTRSRWGGTDQEMYEDFLRQCLISEGEDINAPLTRYRAAVFTVRYLGQNLSAEQTSAFINPFQDTIDPTYLGFVTLSKHFGIFPGDANGNFNGNSVMTRAEAATIIYRTLSV